MNLFAETRSALNWVFQILRQLMRVVPGVTLAIVACLTIARVTRLLAFLLPLKVILLVGSTGIPRYFRPFISPENRDMGIAALSAAAFVSYALTLFLEARAKRLADSGGSDLLDAANVMSVVANQRAEMQGIYVRLMQVVSATLFAAAGALVMAALDPALVAYLLGLILCFYLLAAWALNGATPLSRNWLARSIDQGLGSYLGVLSSLAFLTGFLVILYPFLMHGGGNILVAIICVTLLRQFMTALTGAAKDVVALVQKRQLVDALVFPDRQFHRLEGKDQRTLRELFGRRQREELIADKLADLRQPGQAVRVEWLDPPVQGMAEFAVVFDGPEGPERRLRLRAFPPRLRRLMENEELLFRHVAREAVGAAPVVSRFTHGEYECIVYDAGAPPESPALAALQGDFIASLWCAELPTSLVRIYSASHKAMHERLTDDLAARMEIAVDNDEDAKALARLREALPAIREMIAAMPLRLTNASFTPAETALRPDGGGVHVLGGWGRWSLEPAGAGLPFPYVNEDRCATLLAQARGRRADSVADWVEPGHLLLARRCGLMEQAIQRGAMKTGLATAMLILADIEALQGVPA